VAAASLPFPLSMISEGQSRPAAPDELPLIYEGKVRRVYDAGTGRLLIVATDRVSAYDVVFPEPVPGKGRVLNQLSAWWFGKTGHIVRNHLITVRDEEILSHPAEPAIAGRMALVHRCQPIRYECVVRGYLDGSAWREYQQTGCVAGVPMPAGLQRRDPLPAPLFTPARKNLQGHDENITVDELRGEAGSALAGQLEAASLALFRFAHGLLQPQGLVLLDTKFEFGHIGNELVLMDEIFTPDSSRFMRLPKPGASPRDGIMLDKQFLRDYLTAQGFNGEGDPPPLPQVIVQGLADRYAEVDRLIRNMAAE
jgi:phosphoribosylaminoimidazole-succinocarboxamide synthase